MAAFEYEVLVPRHPLGRYVDHLWFARGSMVAARERISPTGSTVLGIVLGSPIVQVPRNGEGEPFVARTGFMIGPHDQPIMNEPTAETWAVGIVTTPIGCMAALGVEPSAIRGRVGAADAWPAFVAVRDTIADAANAVDSLAIVERALLAGLDESDHRLPRVAAAVETIADDPVVPIAVVAASLGVSHAHLDREFRRIVGIGPRVLARILRLRRLLESIDVYGQVAWTRLAAELGWFDQAHLIRDFRRFTGVTPSAYVAAQRDGYAPDEALPGFVPEQAPTFDSGCSSLSV